MSNTRIFSHHIFSRHTTSSATTRPIARTGADRLSYSGYLPLIIYLGYTRSVPRPSLIKYGSTSGNVQAQCADNLTGSSPLSLSKQDELVRSCTIDETSHEAGWRVHDRAQRDAGQPAALTFAGHSSHFLYKIKHGN